MLSPSLKRMSTSDFPSIFEMSSDFSGGASCKFGD